MTDHGVARDQRAGGDHDPVVGSARDQLGEVVELGCELLNDAEELVNLEVLHGRFTVRPALTTKLAIEVVEERRCDPHRSSIHGSPLRGCFRSCDSLFDTRPYPLEELGGHVIEISDDARLKDLVAFGRR